MRKKSRLTTLDSVLREVAHELKFEDKLEQAMLYRLWTETVGEQIARNAGPVLVRGGVLHVNVSSPVWVQELQFLRSMLLEKINARLSDEKISDIRFKVGPVASSGSRHDDDRPLPELDDNEKLSTQAESAHIADPDVRQAFQDLMAAYLKNRKPVA
jgi:hypothetical protein